MERTKKLCDNCQREISSSNYQRHIIACNRPKRIPKIRGIDFDPNIGYSDVSRVAWNKGLSKKNDERLAKASLTLRTNLANGNAKKRNWSEEQKLLSSERAKKQKLGGYRPHPNRGEYYNNVWFDSKWEVALAKEFDINSIKWERPKVGFIWNDSGQRYYPDFYLPEYEVYVEPKNEYLAKIQQEKLTETVKRHNIKLIVITSKDNLTWNYVKENIALMAQLVVAQSW